MFDVIQFLDSYGIEKFREGKNVQDGWVNIKCPLCDDHSNHGGFNLSGVYYNCWRCGSSSIPWVIKNLLGISYSKAIDVFQQFDSDSVEVPDIVEKEQMQFFVPGNVIEERHMRYLRNRGFDEEVVRKFDLRGTERFGDYRNRIVIPIYFNGYVVSWQLRTIVDAEPRYITCPDNVSIIPAKDVLYNIDSCNKRKAIVMEGVVDVWKFGDGACATFGTSFTAKQLTLMSELLDDVFILFDRDDAGEEAAEKLAVLLDGVEVDTEIIEIEQEDPGSLSIEEAQKIKDELGV
jgi:5S rRNA maturation endonuclease (ribonuclease M5)